MAQQVAFAHAGHGAHVHVQVGAADGGGCHSQDGIALHSRVDVLISVLATPSLITRLTSCARCRMTAACTAADSLTLRMKLRISSSDHLDVASVQISSRLTCTLTQFHTVTWW
jgi:hypothetical protein